MRILLVDDSSAIRHIQRKILESLENIEVEEAQDGEAALQKLKAAEVDLVLLDWNMPKMDGLTTLKNIRANEATKNVKVVMCTSESEKKRVFEAIQSGANNYIVKPFTPETLTAKLKELGFS